MNTDLFHGKPNAPQLLIILTYSILIGIAFTILFFKQSFGINFPIFIALFLTFLLTIGNYFRLKIKPQTFLLLIPVLFLASMVFIRASGMLTFLNVATTLFLLFLLTKSIIGEKIHKFHVADYFKSIIGPPFSYVTKFFDYLHEISGLKQHMTKHVVFIQILRGMLLAIPLLVIFLVLFSSADAIFQKYVTDFFKFEGGEDFISRSLTFLASTALAAGVFYFLLKPDLLNKEKSEQKSKLGNIEVGVILGLINVLFLFFISIQITYIFGGEQNISLEGFTYAQYARKGFFELLLVALISFLVIWFTDKMARSDHKQLSPAYKILASLLSIQVLVIMSSAFMRLTMYEYAYGFTEMRLFSHAFTIYLGLIYLMLLYKIIFDSRENIFAVNSFIITLISLAVLNIMNPDNFILEQNINRFLETEKFDQHYNINLSVDSIPALIKGIPILKEKGCRSIEYIEKSLENRLKRMNESDSYFEWQSFHLARYNSKTLLEEVT